jgi:adenosylcobyric acid synthase
MLGRTVHDPHGIEGAAGTSEGLGVFDMVTTLHPDKQLRNVAGRLCIDDATVRGYEIHCGSSEGPALDRPSARLADSRPDGALSADGLVLGSYLHGLFDAPGALAALLRWAGLRGGETLDMAALREHAIDRVADAVEAHLDTGRLSSLLEAR